VSEPTRIWTISRFAELDSTNRYLLDEARAGAPEGAVVVADHQTSGRGRLDRSWEAPPGSSLLVSVLLRPALGADDAHVVVMAAALALADAVGAVAGFTPDLKWPNDLVVRDRKLAGLLAEREPGAGGSLAAVIVGAGVNVQWTTFPPELADRATACNLEAGRVVDRDALLEHYLEGLGYRLDALAAVPGEYRERLGTLGRRVRVEQAGGALTGTAVDVRDAGELVVRDDNGAEHVVTVGDVVHLRTG
jgi:BirA family transcriptional regulator, biotin operon repressor / biotin---[acetyl-CoA-carboxylase] ligase